MSPADYILAFLSIVLALALQEVLQGVGGVLRRGRLRALPLAQYVIAASLVVQMVQFWWAMWFWRDITLWTITDFVLMLAGLTLLYLLAYLIFPGEDVENAESYYLASAGRIWVLLTLQLASVSVAVVAVRDVSPTPTDGVPLAIILACTVVAIRTERPGVHALIAGILLGVNGVSLAMLPALA